MHTQGYIFSDISEVLVYSKNIDTHRKNKNILIIGPILYHMVGSYSYIVYYGEYFSHISL